MIFLKRYCHSLTTILIQSCASNNGSLSKEAPYLNALQTHNFKSPMDSRYFTPIYKVMTGSVKKNVKLLFPVAHFFKVSLTYLKIDLDSVPRPRSPLKKPVFFPFFERKRIVQKFRKTLQFLATVVDPSFLLKIPLLKTLSRT